MASISGQIASPGSFSQVNAPSLINSIDTTQKTEKVITDRLSQTPERVHCTSEQKSFIQSQSHLLNTPRDILLLILRYLKGTELITASRSCKRFHEVSQNELLYKKLLEEEFPERKLVKGVSFQAQYHAAADFYLNLKQAKCEKDLFKEGQQKCGFEHLHSNLGTVLSFKVLGHLLIQQHFGCIEIWEKNDKGRFCNLLSITLPRMPIDEVTIHVIDSFLFLTTGFTQHRNDWFYQLCQDKKGWFQELKREKCFAAIVGDLCFIENPKNFSLSVMKVGAAGALELQQVLEVPEAEKASIERICTVKESGNLLVTQYQKSDTSSLIIIWEKNEEGEYKKLVQMNEFREKIDFLQKSGDFLFMQGKKETFYWKRGEEKLTGFNFAVDHFHEVNSFNVIGNLLIMQRSRPGRKAGKLEFFEFYEDVNHQGLKLIHSMSNINCSQIVRDLLVVARVDPETLDPYLEVWQIKTNSPPQFLVKKLLYSEVHYMEFVDDFLALDYCNGGREIWYFSSKDIQQQKEIAARRILILSRESAPHTG